SINARSTPLVALEAESPVRAVRAGITQSPSGGRLRTGRRRRSQGDERASRDAARAPAVANSTAEPDEACASAESFAFDVVRGQSVDHEDRDEQRGEAEARISREDEKALHDDEPGEPVAKDEPQLVTAEEREPRSEGERGDQEIPDAPHDEVVSERAGRHVVHA